MSQSPPPLQPLARTDFYREIRRNKLRTAVILLCFILLIAIAGTAVDLLLGFGVAGVIVALVIAAILGFVSYYNSDKVALAAARARPADGPEYQRYHNLVEGLCIAAGLPKPRLYVVDDPAPNAFATGRNPKHAALAVTTGLLQEMNRVELEGVVAHELSHVKNYDILASTVAVIAVGAVALLANIGLRFWIFGGNRDEGGDDGGLGIILAIVSIALLVLAPIAAQMMQFAMSRKRELLADATGVQLTRYPPGLASALKKLQTDQAVVQHANHATAQLWIESPLDRTENAKGSWLNRAFDTHPPLDERIKILDAM
ncbi:MAG TPA: M48 family metalloprotease [Acidimicrobiia bacterium]|nr:M48 family metalloprotease [Acidimicrobiia bacterium]